MYPLLLLQMPNEEVTDSDTVSKSGSESASKGATYAGSNTHMDTGSYHSKSYTKSS